MNSLWIRILNYLLETDQLTAKKIARAIRLEILDNTLPLGTVLPMRKDVASFLKISRAEVDAAWNRLEDGYHLIYRSNREFWIVSVMPVNRGEEEPAAAVPIAQSRRRKIYLNQVTYNDDAEQNRSVGNLMKRTINYMELRDGMHGDAEMDAGLVAEMRTIVNGSIYSRYGQEELVYSQDAKMLMFQLCAAVVSPKAIAVIIGPAPLWVFNAFREAARKVQLIDAENDGLPINELAKVMKNNTVGMLYLSSRSPSPISYKLNLDRIDELSGLIRGHKVVILEHDQFAGSLLANENLLAKAFLDQKIMLLYMRTLSSINSELAKVNILAGPAKVIQLIKKKMLNSSNLISPAMASKIIQMVRNSLLCQAEARVAELTRKMNAVAKEVLLAAGLFNPDGIISRDGWFFHLDPLYGEFPENVFEKLVDDRIYIFNFRDYTGALNLKNGIMISIADYFDEQRLRQDLEYLIDRLSKMLVTIDIKAFIN